MRHFYRSHTNPADVLVAADAFFGRRRHALLTHAQPLPALRARRNAQLRSAIDGRDFDLRAQRRLRDRDRHGDEDVVAFAAKHRVLAHANDDVKVAGGSTVRAGIAFARQADTLPVASSRLDAHFNRFISGNCAIARARPANSLLLPTATALRAGDVELHVAAHLRDLAFAPAVRASPACGDGAGAVTRLADIATRYIQLDHRAFYRLPKIYADLIFKVAARFRAAGLRAAAAEHAGEDVAETASSTSAAAPARAWFAGCKVRKIEPAEIEGYALRARASSAASSGRRAESASAESAAARVCLRRRRIDVV